MSIIPPNSKQLSNNIHRHPEPWDQILGTVNEEQHQTLLPLENHQKIIIAPASVPSDVSVPSIVDKQPESKPTSVTSKNSHKSILKHFQRQLSFRLSVGGKGSDNEMISTHPHLSRYRQSRFSSRRVRKRVVFKHGDCNIVQGNVAKRRRKYLQDIFTTLVDAQWRWTLLVFACSFLLSWLGFSLVWWIIAYTHDDLIPDHLPGGNHSAEWTPCVTNIQSFTSCFLFSVETQHTIGYGGRTTTEECPEAIFVMCLQSITGVFIQAFMVGIVFAKLARPKKRTETLLFSRNAVICHRDGQPCLMFRVGDMRKSHIIEAHVRAQLIRHKVTREGEQLPFYQQELKVGGDGEEDKIFFIWPTTIVHKINKTSPLYKLSATDLLTERFEIIVMLEGVIESTGMTTQARSSYLPSEILWGHRFDPIVTFKRDLGQYEVDYTLFNNTKEVDTPLCSAKQLDDHRAMYNNNKESHLLREHSVDHLTPGLYHTRSPSSDTLDISSVESLSLDEHIIMIAPPSGEGHHPPPPNHHPHPPTPKTLQVPACTITGPEQ
ncbi:G protein-activated inward rectifier potassium channel 3-like isoform X2 [Chrysoperla carnea]|uniref:G protein-activated inward rectifier potassium channel 3-like isoform X2 n=1 Tax=Chrysoperla carnea TaxID=189513 RepID=UPI001D06BA33|nr:G protein-activated inward rectifier potassium channel 3-like isoform X2 [Chrysoperla carnea]